MKMDDDDKRTQRPSVPLSPRELAQVDQARGETPRGRWLREAVEEKLERDAGVSLEELDTARRPAPRRRNYSERQTGQSQGNGKNAED